MRKPKRLSLEELAPYLWSPPATAPRDPAGDLGKPETIHWAAIFHNDQPVEIEVGFGKGAFLVAAAPARPKVNFFGIEVVRKYQLFTATRLAKRHLLNVHLACADGRQILREQVPAKSVQAIHVYFPDPWWKTRHHKRRVFTPDFVTSCTRSLWVGGRLYLATDVPEYFASMAGLCAAEPGLRLMPNAPPAHGLDYLTNFERKAREQGQPVQRAVYERVVTG
jgi:tRNA (guanine-N7-)-methyltransferase